MRRRNLTTGFTLIELLVVIAIIGLLSSVVIASLNSARAKARDARRISDIQQLQTALELYYDKYGVYPQSGGCVQGIQPNAGWYNSVESLQNGHWIRDAANGCKDLSEFLPSDPKDPAQTASASWLPANPHTYFYYSASYTTGSQPAGQWYMIVYGLENYPSALEGQDSVTAPNGQCFDYGGGNCTAIIEGNGILTPGKDNLR